MWAMLAQLQFTLNKVITFKVLIRIMMGMGVGVQDTFLK